ncbi:pilus assembly PilX family protein [Spongorhabdus nitratireducens]
MKAAPDFILAYRSRATFSPRSSEGNVLIVSLVFLLVLTIAGLTSVSISSLEEKMAGNYRNYQLAFHAAEAALVEAEDYVKDQVTDIGNFDANCSNGRCFGGNNINDIGVCSAGSFEPWNDSDVWNSTGRTRQVTVDLGNVSARARYIVEFICYSPRYPKGPVPSPLKPNEWFHQFRITVLAEGGVPTAKVMLQSLYRKVL